MTRVRAGLVALFGAVLFAVGTQPALAQSTGSETGRLIWDLNENLLYAAVPITVLVEGILIYTVLRYKDNDEPLPTKENRRLEITWTIATAIILLFVGVASYQVFASPLVTPGAAQEVQTEGEAVEIEVVAQRFNWNFYYNGTVANQSQEAGPDNRIQSTNTLVLPANRTVILSVTSDDWIHAFHAPALGLKTDAMPERHETIRTRDLDEGQYQLYCAEYCGSGHSQMLGEIEVRSEEDFQAWLDEQQES